MCTTSCCSLSVDDQHRREAVLDGLLIFIVLLMVISCVAVMKLQNVPVDLLSGQQTREHSLAELDHALAAAEAHVTKLLADAAAAEERVSEQSISQHCIITQHALLYSTEHLACHLICVNILLGGISRSLTLLAYMVGLS